MESGGRSPGHRGEKLRAAEAVLGSEPTFSGKTEHPNGSEAQRCYVPIDENRDAKSDLGWFELGLNQRE